MTTIKALTNKLTGGYKHVLDYYNNNKDSSWEPLQQSRTAEGGFEISLNTEELKRRKEWLKQINAIGDYNDTVRQLRWFHNSELTSGCHNGFTEEETTLLFKALQYTCGADKIIMI